MNIVMVDQKWAVSDRQCRRENRNMVKFIGKVALLLIAVTCIDAWFLV